MSKFTKLLALFLAAIMLLSLTACGGGATEDTTPSTTTPTETPTDTPENTPPVIVTYEDRTYKIAENLESIKVTGRSLVCDDGVTIDWSASGIEFCAECKGTVSLTVTSSEPCRLLVYVDGESRTVEIAKGTAAYELATELAEGVHNIRVVKKNDNAVESTPDILTAVSEISMCGLLRDKPADKKYLVEFIGDSITCGLGTVAPSSLETDATVTYAYLAAQTLDVDYSFVSISGIGVVKSTDQNGGLVMGDIYGYTNYYRDQTAKYEPTRKADLVVIALNTNDNGRNPTKAQYDAKATELINSVKAVHGDDVKIIWVSTLMSGRGMCDIYAEYIMHGLGGAQAGYYFMLGTPDSSGAFTHPSVAGHAVNAEKLVKFIKDNKILELN